MKSSEVVMEKIDPNVYTREKEREQINFRLPVYYFLHKVTTESGSSIFIPFLRSQTS